MIYSCCNDNRRAVVLGNPTVNGIDYLELLSSADLAGSPPQQTLLVYCLRPAPTSLTAANVIIEGGESITSITAQWIVRADHPLPGGAIPFISAIPSPANQNVLVIRTSVAGDFSRYTLRLVNDASVASQGGFYVTEALAGFDPQLAEVTFSFKIECGPEFDCKPTQPACPPDSPTPPPINYLAKDYGSFRSILLDRMNQLLPAWGATSEADLGVALAELIAWAGDQLSYHQDAVTTEAYLPTARSRISLRRHALLVDYRVHDGCNARVWIRLTVGVPVFLDRNATRFYTFAPGTPANLAPGAGNEQAALDAGVIAFEPMQSANLYPEHNLMQFYTWGDTNCCLPQGATEATLAGSFPNLQAGDVLIFQEVMGPQTGAAADADIRHRYAVRLTSVATQNALGQPLTDPLFEQGTGAPIVSASQKPAPVTEIQWDSQDALPAPVCLSSAFLDSTGALKNLSGVSVVFGNVVLADQGLTMPDVALPSVPQPSLFQPPSASGNRCTPTARVPLLVRYRPQVPFGPITQVVALPVAGSPATPGAVPLASTGAVSLTDTNGFTCLAVQAAAPLSWPQYFGIVASQGNAGTFDIAVVFHPTGAATPVVLEQFSNLTLATAPAIDSHLVSVSVPVGATAPTVFTAVPVQLSNSGAVPIQSGGVTYLNVTPLKPLSWPPQFAVLAQGNLAKPSVFNLLLLYQPPAGARGVSVPVVVEQFNSLSLSNVASAFSAGSALLTVRSFQQEPNPSLAATDLMNYNANEALPVITPAGTLNGVNSTWAPVPDLLASGPTDKNFVVEVESDGTAWLRFGDNTNGMTPVSGTAFTATCRIGNGTAGNVGAESLVFLAGDPRIQSCTNPMPASGGKDPETSAQIQRRAPQAFLTQERAVTLTDYAVTTKNNAQVEDAAATLRWTGSWYTVFIAAEPAGGGNLSPMLRRSLTQFVNRYRLAGQDLKLEGPDYVSLDIELTVCVASNYFRSDVQQALLQVLGNGKLPNGGPALFNSDNFRLGQTVYLSPVYAAARKIAGVQTVTATVFQPQGVPAGTFLQDGAIPIGPFQVARLDNDPSLPGNGALTLTMLGGK